MSFSEIPCLSLAIAPLRTAGHFAIHVTKAPYPGGFVLHECLWTESLTNLWQGWQEMFSTRVLPSVPQVSQVSTPLPDSVLVPETAPMEGVADNGLRVGRAGRLMQNLGIHLWQWLFDGLVQNSLNQSQGIAMGQGKPLRLRLEIRDPDMIALPWEIMQDAAGKQAISLSQQLLFSRTTSDVHVLPPLRSDYMLKILLVLGQDAAPADASLMGEATGYPDSHILQLKQEADALARVLKISGSTGIGRMTSTPCQVDTLVQPTPAELIRTLETQTYNVFFYSGHGVPAPDGGLLYLRPGMTLNGTELAQVLTRRQVKLAVFNACWGAQPDHSSQGSSDSPNSHPSQTIPRSSLAEVLIHHGVPAVLGMREPITDEEALSFIQAFAKALAERMPIDQAVAVARQHLLTLYRFNQPAWTLPVLYMHPEYDGELLKPMESTPTEMPGTITKFGQEISNASLRSLKTAKVWTIQGGIMRVGRDRAENDLVIQEDQSGVSRKHAVIFCRQSQQDGTSQVAYFLEDFSRFGTWILDPAGESNGWQKIHRQEVPLHSGAQIKFGSSQNETLEFIVHE
ncbi:CHAT domain-containing protein [Leptothermofonsia sichuanensis E412]|uniref:CHAT domain-containing protein n=1 Tax=Leptothermofonsia sichuanensis TaxID=2917832 RepID=UPI001CA69DAB|nr:CHAT domain-containing protein [Leptothermofonsia sichuanensis]QZZ19192.1 CHAT domain-containing protein [Leptothermofonsia sichuanensis E412]